MNHDTGVILWRIWRLISKPEAIVFLVPLLVLLAGILYIVASLFISWLKKKEAKRIQKRKERVREQSDWFRGVQKLNEEIHFYTDILDRGHSTHYVSVTSKAKFDKADPLSGLYEFVRENREQIERALEQTARNRVIRDMYSRKVRALQKEPTVQQCENTGVTMEQFLEWEKELVDGIRLPIHGSYSITCFVVYTSPQGRNHYSKSKTVGETGIRDIMQKLDAESTLHASEAWRRKTERAKVTPSVRFRIIQRDGGRCCVCGRSASDGIELEVDHIVPIARGGSSIDSNLQTLCRDCNRGKGVNV